MFASGLSLRVAGKIQSYVVDPFANETTICCMCRHVCLHFALQRGSQTMCQQGLSAMGVGLAALCAAQTPPIPTFFNLNTDHPSDERRLHHVDSNH